MARIKATRNSTKSDVIIHQAAKLFRQKGYQASSMRELAVALGIEAPSLYNHIGSKGELLERICFNTAGKFNDQLNSLEGKSLSATKKLEKLIRFHIQVMLKTFDEVFVANHEWKHLKEPLLAEFLGQRKIYESRMIQIVKDGINDHEFRQVHPHVTVLTILSAVRGLEFWQKHKDQVNIRALENNIVQHLIKGIKA